MDDREFEGAESAMRPADVRGERESGEEAKAPPSTHGDRSEGASVSQAEPAGVGSDMMTLRQAADRTGLSATTLRRYIKSGRLRARLVPGRYGPEYVVDERALEAAGLDPRPDDGGPAHETSGALVRREPVAPIGDVVPGLLYRELLMKHEQLLVQYGALRVSGQQLYEVRQEAERRAREARRAVEELEQVRNRHAREIGQLKSQLRRAALEIAERDEEIRRLKLRLREAEIALRNAATAESIDTRFEQRFTAPPSAPRELPVDAPDH
ncbi:MAG: hypothetical protein Kow0062_13440 [Acidobacteriota bacterium]